MSSTDLRSSMRSIRQSLCAIAGITFLNWGLSLLIWAGEERQLKKIVDVIRGLATEEKQ